MPHQITHHITSRLLKSFSLMSRKWQQFLFFYLKKFIHFVVWIFFNFIIFFSLSDDVQRCVCMIQTHTHFISMITLILQKKKIVFVWNENNFSARRDLRLKNFLSSSFFYLEKKFLVTECFREHFSFPIAILDHHQQKNFPKDSQKKE